MNVIIDTSILIEIENNNKKVIEQIEELKDTPTSEICITLFNFCEFYFGIINKSVNNKEKALKKLDEYVLLNTTRKTGVIFCEILNKLKKSGKSIPQFDLMILSIAIENNMTLITADNHFKKIDGLKTVVLEL